VKAAEKWIPCTATFPDYEICLGPTIAIKRNRGVQGSYKGKIVSIQHYKGQFWATLYDRFGKAKRVNILDMAGWASAAEWKRRGRSKPKAETAKTDQKTGRKWIAASQPVPAPPKPTRAAIEGWIRDIQAGDYAAFVKRNKVAEYEAMLAELDAEERLPLDAVFPTPPTSESPVNTGAK
jgi:hypothetical protein